MAVEVAIIENGIKSCSVSGETPHRAIRRFLRYVKIKGLYEEREEGR